MIDTTTLVLCVALVVLLYVLYVKRVSTVKAGMLVLSDGSVATEPVLGAISAGAGMRHLGRRTDGYGGDVVAPFLASVQLPTTADSSCGCSATDPMTAEGLSIARKSKKAGLVLGKLGDAALQRSMSGH